MTSDSLERTFTCPESPQLTLSNIRGSVEIRPGEAGVITVRASKLIDSGDADNTRIQFSQSDSGIVKVATRYDNHWYRFFYRPRPCKVDYVVSAPENCVLKVRGVSNTAKIESMKGGLDISTVSGPLQLFSIGGNIQVKTVSGDITGESISGSGYLTGVSGDISLRDCQFQVLKAKTVSGDITLQSSLGEGPFDFDSVSGDIQLEVPAALGVTVVSSSLSGDVKTTSPISHMNQSDQHRRFEIMGGGVEIHHHSVSGDLIILNEDSMSETDGTLDQHEGEAEATDRVEILDRIANGDLTVEEALQQFDEVKLN
jgi:hypothetical protein